MEPATHFIHEVMTDMSSRNPQPRDDLRSTSPLQVTGGFHFSDVVEKGFADDQINIECKFPHF